MNINEPVPVKAEQLTAFYAKSHQHQKDIEYQVNCMLAFEGETLSDAHWHVCYKLYVAIRKYFLASKANIYPVCDREILNRQLTDSSKSRVRYVGGYCLQSVRKQYVNQVTAAMYMKTSDGVSKYEQACKMVKVLNCLREEEEYIKHTTEEEGSLKDVIRKQNVSRGLTHIPDELYKFFVVLCDMCLRLLVDKNVNSYDASLYEFCINSIINTESLRDEFITIINNRYSTVDLAEGLVDPITIPPSVTTQLFESISRKFLLVMLNQFRRDLLQSFRISKTMAHRKQIQVRKQKQDSKKQTVTYESIKKDTSVKKEMSYSLMRGLLLGKVDIFKDMKKTEILKLCLAFNLKVSPKTKKSVIIDKLSNAVICSSEMCNPEALCEESESPASQVQTRETSLGQPQAASSSDMNETMDAESSASIIGNSEVETQPSTSTTQHLPDPMETDEFEDSDLCKKCNKMGKPGVQWIQCNSCSGWLHRNCAGLSAKKAWVKLAKTGSEFFCRECK